MRDVEVIAVRKSVIEGAPAVETIAAYEQDARARGFLAGATDERIQDFAERSGAAQGTDPFGNPSSCRDTFGRCSIRTSRVRQLVANETNVPGDLVAKTVRECVQGSLEPFVKGQCGC